MKPFHLCLTLSYSFERYKFYLALDNSLCDEYATAPFLQCIFVTFGQVRVHAAFFSLLFLRLTPYCRYISEKVVRALAVGAVPVMWSRVEGWESIVPGPFAAVFVEDFGYDATMLVRALEAEAADEHMYTQVCLPFFLFVRQPHHLVLAIFTPCLFTVGAAAGVCVVFVHCCCCSVTRGGSRCDAMHVDQPCLA